MTGVESTSKCPVCGGDAELYLETKTSESDFNCRTCGYAEYQEIEKRAGQLYWVTTEQRPMTHDGVQVGSKLIPDGTWTPEKFARPDGCHCYGCQRKDEVRG